MADHFLWWGFPVITCTQSVPARKYIEGRDWKFGIHGIRTHEIWSLILVWPGSWWSRQLESSSLIRDRTYLVPIFITATDWIMWALAIGLRLGQKRVFLFYCNLRITSLFDDAIWHCIIDWKLGYFITLTICYTSYLYGTCQIVLFLQAQNPKLEINILISIFVFVI